MKRLFLVLFIGILAVTIWLLTKREPDNFEAAVETTEIEIKEKFKEPNIQTEAWDKFSQKIKSISQIEIPEDMLDFSVEIKSLNVDKVRAPLQQVVKSTLDCYEENQCDFEMPEEGEYYDPSEVPALKLLRRQLQIALELGIDIAEDDLFKAITLPNDDVVQSAFTLILRNHNEVSKKDLFAKLEKIDGAAFGPVAKKLLMATKGDSKAYNELLEAFIRTLEEKDPFTTLEALEAFRGLPIDQSQFEDLGKIACAWRVKADHNWKMAVSSLKAIAKEQSLTFDSSRICQ
ncbi:MAG: hypothetical protein Fur0010_01820 [Bdellovibrio sp.]